MLLTASDRSRHNRVILQLVQRAAVWVLLAPVSAFGWSGISAHAHRGDAHHDGVVHSHLAPHHLGHPSHDATDLQDDADDGVVWLDGAAAPSMSGPLPFSLVASTVPAAAVPSRPSWTPTPADDRAPAHGPPRATLSFRGPPPACLS